MIPTTDTADMSRLHDEPSRALRIFPGSAHRRSAFTLYEDDGLSWRYRDREYAEVQYTLEWTPKTIRVRADKRGSYPLPSAKVRVVPQPGEHRPLRLSADGIVLEIARRP